MLFKKRVQTYGKNKYKNRIVKVILLIILIANMAVEFGGLVFDRKFVTTKGKDHDYHLRKSKG